VSGKMLWLIVIEAVLLIVITVAFAPVGYLGIEVEPDGSTLFLDGHFIGHSPMYLAFITPKHYHLEVGKVAVNGGVAYKGKTANLYVRRFTKTMTSFELEPLYSYVIRSEPPGATITVDGKVYDEETPCRIYNVEAGKHEMILDLEGQPSIRYIIDTKETPENLFLDFNSNYKLYCDSFPQGARVRIDGIISGKTPCMVEGLTKDEHTFELELHGWKTLRSVVNLAEKGNKVTFTLARDHQPVESP
jgi:hypothetical protein